MPWQPYAHRHLVTAFPALDTTRRRVGRDRRTGDRTGRQYRQHGNRARHRNSQLHNGSCMAEYERENFFFKTPGKILSRSQNPAGLYDNCRKTIPYHASALSRLIDCHSMPTSASSSSAPPPNRPVSKVADRYVATDDLEAGRQRRADAAAPLLIKGRARHGQDDAGRGSGARAWTARCCNGTSSPPPRRTRACTNTTRSRACAIRSWATKVRDIRNHIVQGTLWQAFEAPEPVVLLIDEIDKADIEFPMTCCARPRPHGIP